MMALDRAAFYDAELQRHHQRLFAALEVGPRDRVLDIGCGAGQSSLEAARLAVEGTALGVDVSEDMLEIARQRGVEAGLGNVSFELADAQVHAFPAAHFDLCISRFGTMFFADPVTAFTNIGRAMRSGARLVMLVWQSRERNEWSMAIQEALALPGASSAKPRPAFSLSDPAVTTQILTAAGFTAIDFAEVHEPVFYGPTVDAAFEAVVGVFLAGPPSDEVRQRLCAMLAAHLTADGVVFDSHAWLVTAHKA